MRGLLQARRRSTHTAPTTNRSDVDADLAGLAAGCPASRGPAAGRRVPVDARRRRPAPGRRASTGRAGKPQQRPHDEPRRRSRRCSTCGRAPAQKPGLRRRAAPAWRSAARSVARTPQTRPTTPISYRDADQRDTRSSPCGIASCTELRAPAAVTGSSQCSSQRVAAGEVRAG